MGEPGPFVGHEKERAELGRLMRAAALGRGGLVLVAGEAGVGKSRLVREAARGLPLRTLSASAVRGSTAPYGLFARVFRRFLAESGRGPGVLGDLWPHLTPILPELPIPGGVEPEPALLSLAVRSALVALEEGGPAVVVLDDLHRADEATLELLAELPVELEGRRLLVLGMYREESTPAGLPLLRLRAELRRSGALREIRVLPLPPADTTGLARAILGGAVSEDLATTVYRRSQGVPFFVVELLRTWRDGGYLLVGADGWRMQPGREPPLPVSVRDQVLGGIEDLSTREREALEGASILGDRFDPALLPTVDAEETELSGAFRLGLLVETEEGGPAFRHPLVREAIFHAIPWPRRRALLARIGTCSRHGIYGPERECLACHVGGLLETGRWKEASEICRGILVDGPGGSPCRTVAAGLGGLLDALQGRVRSARKLLLDAEEGLADLHFLGLELDILWGLAVVAELEGDVETGARRLRALRDRWEETRNRYSVVHPLRWGATFFALQGRGEEVRRCAEALARVAAEDDSPEALAALEHALGECALLDGSFGRAASDFHRAMVLLEPLGVPFQHAHTEIRQAAALALAGDRDEAARHFVEGHRTASRLGARPLARQAARGLRELGESVQERLGRRAAGDLERDGLTRRELQVLERVNRGRSNRAIARELFLSPRTVEMHVGNALLKLGCGSRSEAAYRARELKILH